MTIKVEIQELREEQRLPISNLCERCGGKLLADYGEIFCINCGYRPLNFTVITMGDKWKRLKSY